MGRNNSKSNKSRRQRDLRKEVLAVFKSHSEKPLNYKQVSSALGVKDAQLRILIAEVIRDEAERGKLIRVERGKYKLKDTPKEYLEGIIQITKTGRGFVTVDGFDEDVRIRQYDTKDAFWGDRVQISFNPYGKNPRGKVVKVVERARQRYVGVLEMNERHAFVVPTDTKIHVDFFIPKNEINGAANGQKVIVELKDWNKPTDNPVATITEILGEVGDNDTEMHAIMAEYDLPYEFPDEVLRDAEKINQNIEAQEIAKRRDFRKVLTFTIDPEDAKDFDDALSLQKLKNGHWEVGVHIADVSHYLKPGSILDKEAYYRATSVYLVDRTIPMLPEVLSNQLCSLRPNEDKYCFSAVFEINDKAEVVSEWFGRTVIHSARRFTYEEAQERIESGKGDLSKEINVLDGLAKIMRSRRFSQGSIDFHSSEVRFKLDEKGKPIGVYVKEMKDSNKLIEEFMLLANTRVARFVAKQKKTYIYRIHDNPDPVKLLTLRDFVTKFGYKLPVPNEGNAAQIIRGLLKQVEGTPERDVVQKMSIRSMAKAEYSTDNVGHFGLGFEFYSHFTSPIRRYPDVMAHRLLQLYLDRGKSANAEDYERQCRQCSLKEKRAQEAEWASIKYKSVEFMMSRIGENFKGMISGVTGWGLYVELTDTKCEGMVSLNTITGDHFEFDKDRYVIYGKRTGQEFHLGDSVEVTVVAADLVKRTLDLELIG